MFWQIVGLIEADEIQFHKTIEEAGLKRLLSSEITFLKEWVHVMQPVALSLDILQQDKNMFIGYLAPVIGSLLKQLRATRTYNGRALKYCDVLSRTLLEAVPKPKRFGNYLNIQQMELAMAAVLIPSFKLDWLDDEAERQIVKTNLLQEIKKVSYLFIF